MKFLNLALPCVGILGIFSMTSAANAVEVDLVTLTCGKYQNEMSASAARTLSADPINTMMWLFGYSVAKSGARVMYGGALPAFGFSLDAECRKNPNESLLDALALVKPDASKPMDLMTLECATFASRHVELARTDRESADTIMMWLLGFSVASAGSHVFDTAALNAFEPALLAECSKHPDHSLFDALGAVKLAKAPR